MLTLIFGGGVMWLCLDIRGDYACFTRPEMKVERVSYEIITPSAARSIFESILWRPSFRWVIKKIDVINPISWINFNRNELKNKLSYQKVSHAMTTGYGYLGQQIEDERQPRACLILKNVRYRIYASIVLTQAASSEDSISKFSAMFIRRAKKGQCINQPYLGCREFTCAFELVTESTESDPVSDITKDLGMILYDMNYSNHQQPEPVFFHGQIIRGVVLIPELNMLV